MLPPASAVGTIAASCWVTAARIWIGALAQHLGRSFGGHQDQPPGDRVVADRLEKSPERSHQHRGGVIRIRLLGDEGHELLDGPCALALDHRPKKPGEVVEMRVDHRPGDARPPGDRVDGNRVKAALSRERFGDVQDLLAALRGR